MLLSRTFTLLSALCLSAGGTEAASVSVVRDILKDAAKEDGGAYSITTKAKGSACGPGNDKLSGEAYLPPSFIKTLKTSLNPVHAGREDVGSFVQTTVLTATSKRHVDHYPPAQDGKRSPVDGQVAFVVLNTNDDAFFQHGDTSVPIVEGSLVRFDGGTPHNTVVNSGVVNLLGPFDAWGFQSVGSCPPTPPAPAPPTPACWDNGCGGCNLTIPVPLQQCQNENSGCRVCAVPNFTVPIDSRRKLEQEDSFEDAMNRDLKGAKGGADKPSYNGGETGPKGGKASKAASKAPRGGGGGAPSPTKPSPATPAPTKPSPVTPSPVTPSPVTPSPVTPSPVTPATPSPTDCPETVCPVYTTEFQCIADAAADEYDCLPPTPCIPIDSYNQGSSDNCCSKASDVDESCTCILPDIFNEGDDANCCSNSSDVNGTCGCLLPGFLDEGNDDNCCSSGSDAMCGICQCILNGPDQGSPSNCCCGTSTAGFCNSCEVMRYLEANHDDAKRSLAGLTSKEDIESVLLSNKDLPVDFEGKFYERAEMLTPSECDALINYQEVKHLKPDASIEDVLRLAKKETLPQNEPAAAFEDTYYNPLSITELFTVLGKDKVNELLDFFYESVGKALVKNIWIRRTVNDGTAGNYVDFHTDMQQAKYKQSTMIIALNEDSDVLEGGEMFYLNRNGPVEVHRAQGKAFVHSYDVFHGVAPHKGTRISLLVHLDHDAELTDV